MIEEGSPAPDFTLRDQNNQEVRLSSYQGSRNVLLVFYPFAFTGTCQGELQAIRDNPFDAATVQVLTVSVDSKERGWEGAADAKSRGDDNPGGAHAPRCSRSRGSARRRDLRGPVQE